MLMSLIRGLMLFVVIPIAITIASWLLLGSSFWTVLVALIAIFIIDRYVQATKLKKLILNITYAVLIMAVIHLTLGGVLMNLLSSEFPTVAKFTPRTKVGVDLWLARKMNPGPIVAKLRIFRHMGEVEDSETDRNVKEIFAVKFPNRTSASEKEKAKSFTQLSSIEAKIREADAFREKRASAVAKEMERARKIDCIYDNAISPPRIKEKKVVGHQVVFDRTYTTPMPSRRSMGK